MKTTLLLLFILLLSACTAASPPAPVGTPTADLLSTGYPISVKISGHTYPVIFHCWGTGSPAVILESGMGADWSYWDKVLDMPPDVRVCAYNRSSESNTSQEYAKDLHALLAAAGLEGPYILVGHSFGGFTALLYADRYPAEVAGIVLEDISDPDPENRYLAALPPESPDDSQDMQNLREFFNYKMFFNGNVDFYKSIRQVRTVTSLGDIPLVVISAALPNPYRGDIPQEVNMMLDQIRREEQIELTGLSSDSRQIIAATDQHTIHKYEPHLVIEAILDLVEAARKGGG